MRSRQRGSAYLYVIVCVVIMGALLVELIPYVTQARNWQSRRLRKARADLATESLVQQVMAEATAQPIAYNSVRTLTLNNATASATVTDGSSVVSGSYLLSGTTTIDGQTFRIVRYVTAGVGTTPYSFAVYSANDMNWSGKLVTGASGADGDVFSNGKINLTSVSGTTVNGNAAAKGTISFNGATVTGTMLPNSPPIALPSVSAANYQANATYSLSGTQNVSGTVSFGGMQNGHYEMYYISGDVNFTGTLSGQGIVFINGNLNLTGNAGYANASSRVAWIVTGNVTVAAACTQAVGLTYIGGSLIVNSSDFNLTKGCLVAKAITNGPIIRATRDNFSGTSPTEGVKFCLPGYWP